MISDFHKLSEKISQLAELTQALRSENAELARRMQEAHERVAALLESIPTPEKDEEAA